ncbi:DUF4157 domain-containing protein [Sorangium sp. So ce269]
MSFTRNRKDRGEKQPNGASHAPARDPELARQTTSSDAASPIHISPTGLRVQRQADPAAAGSPAPAAAGADAPARAPGAPGGALIVEDGTPDLQPGQMPKSAFIALLRAEVEAAVQAELEGTAWAVAGCPWVDYWFGHYAGQSAAHGERALFAYAPGCAGASNAAACIPIAVARVREAVQRWARPGEGQPGVDSGEMPKEGTASTEGAAPGLATAVKGTSSDEGGAQLFFKDEGGARAPANPAAVAARLGPGTGLDAGVRARMEGAFGQDFSSVRVHTDARSTRVASDLQATAFTVGRDIVFSRGKYAPGTLRGDALLAHELAHVVQQRGGSRAGGASASMDAPGTSLEQEADRAALEAMQAIHGRTAASDVAVKGLLPGAAGLRIQRCKSDEEPKKVEKTEPELTPVCPTKDGLHFFPGQQLLVYIKGGKAVAQYPARGGPPASKPGGALPADPTTEGEFLLLKEEAYRTQTWKWSRIAWGTQIKDTGSDVQYRLKRDKETWASVADYGFTRDEILKRHQALYGTQVIPSTWIFNDFGPKAFRYYRDVNKNRQYDERVDQLMPDMLHTTPDDEAQVKRGQPVTLTDSHGCVHLKPGDRDDMIGRGILAPGTPFIVHPYTEKYQCP